jgi:hypothetical protein
MSARLPLVLVALASLAAIGCDAGERTEVSLTDLALKVESDGIIRTGSFDLHIARPASASGSSGIRLHTLDILVNSEYGGESFTPIPLGLIGGKVPGVVDPGAEIVSPMAVGLVPGLRADQGLFDSCSVPEGFVLSCTYFDEAEDAFFAVRSPATWVPPKALTGAAWAQTFGDAAPQSATGAAAFADGSSAFVGLSGATNAPLTSFVTKLDAAGNTVWNRQMALTPSPAALMSLVSQGPSLVAASPDGGVVVAGNLDGDLDVGGAVITSTGDTDVFLARLDATGKTIETRRFGDALAQDVRAMDLDAAGNVILVGSLAGAIDFGGGPIAPLLSPSAASYYVAKLPPSGAPIYAKVPVALDPPGGFTASIGADGTAILGGWFTGQAWIGADLAPQSPFVTAFLLALAADGSIAWSKLIEGTVMDRVALDQGDVVAVMTTSIDKLIIDGHEIAGDPFGKTIFARFDPTGSLRYMIPFDSSGIPVVTGLVIDSAGHALISGNIASPFVLAGANVDPAGRSTTFVAELDRSGASVRNLTFGCASSPLSLAVAPSGSRDVLLISTFMGAVDSGKGTIPSAGSTDVLVAKLPAQ